MAKWEQLIAARESKHLSQAEAAEQAQVGVATYQRWEQGKARPQPHHMRSLSLIFQTLFEQKPPMPSPAGVSSSQSTQPPAPTASGDPAPARQVGEVMDEAHALFATCLPMTTHLLSLASAPHSICTEKCCAIRRFIKEWDTMNTTNPNYAITRREALGMMATLPMAILGLNTPQKIVPATQYGTMLAQCAASLEACWELRSSDQDSDRLLVSQCATTYLPSLITMAQQASQHRQQALDLATRYTLIQSFIARHFTSLPEAIRLGINAVALSKETGDIPLQLYAYRGLSISYFYARKYPLALATAQQAEALLRQATQVPGAQPFHAQILGATYGALATAQAKNGIPSDDALGKAMELDPGDEALPFMDFKLATLFLDAGTTCCYSGDQAKAMKWFSMRVDPETLTPKTVQSGNGRIETLTLMTLSTLRAKDRDLEKTVHLWTAGMDGAIALHSEQRFNEALSNYELMETVWPEEKRIAELREHIVRWED